MRAQYDEDLEANPFFVAFKVHQPVLYENSIKKNWIILVPYAGCFTKNKYDDFEFLNHVLVPLIDESNSNNTFMYKTLGNQKIQICDSIIKIFGKETEIFKQIQILFDETFYTENDKTYRVLCISEPINTEISKIDSKLDGGKVFALNSVDDSKSFLWKFMAKRNTKMKVDELVLNSKSKIQKLTSPTVQDCFLIMKDLYINSYQTIASHRTYIKLVRKNESLNSSMKLALEMYLSNCVFNTLFAALTDATAEKDEEINKSTRAFQNIRASKSGIRFDVCENIPKAKRELNSIRKISTPLGICECIRKVIAELSSFRNPKMPVSNISSLSINNSDQNQRISYSNSKSGLMVTSDDLLSALIFLVIKSDIPNWYSFLEYGTQFRFASCSRDDEYQYYLTTLEATLEHIRNMGTNTVEEDLIMDVSVTLSNTSGDSSSSAWTDIMQTSVSSARVGVVAYEINQVRQLFRLIENGQISAVKELIQRSSRVDYCSLTNRRTVGPSNFNNNKFNDHYCHPLCDCKAVMVDRKSCQSLVERTKKSVDFQALPESKTFDTAENTMRKYSIDNQNSQGIMFFLSSVDDKGWNAFHKAAFCGQLEIINILLEYQFLIDSINLDGETALHLAARRGHQDIIFKLLDSGAEITIQNYIGQTALHIAVEYGYKSCVTPLIYYGTMQCASIINFVNNSGNTCLHIAAMWGYESIVECLLDNSASALIKNNKGLRASDIASTRKLANLIKINSHQQELESISKETASTVSKLLQLNIDKSASLKNVKTKSLTTGNNNSKKVKEILPKDFLKNNQPFSTSDSTYRKIEKLLKVIADGDFEMVKFLLEITEDLEISDPININQKLCHPLCQCQKCHPIQNLIIKNNSQQLHVNSANNEGFHCLHIAAIHDRSTIAKFLLRFGADPNSRTKKLELSPLHLAAIYGSIKVLNVLLNHVVTNLNVVDKKQNTPLSYACTKSNIEVIESLLEAKAMVNTSNHRGNTPLHEAARQNQAEVVNLLLAHGADINILNFKKQTPLDMAKDLNIYFILKNALQMNEIKKSSESEIDMTESGMESLSSSLHNDQNLFNVDTDGLSLCSGISLPSSDDNDCNGTSTDRLFPDDLKLDLTSQFLMDKCDSPINFDTSLLERLDKNSKYNYRLIFQDPNSPSISSTNSSK